MVFLGFKCVKRILIGLNVLLILFSIIMISVGIYAKTSSIVSNGVLGGIIFCGVFLLVISLVGIVGTIKHHQVFLFFYMFFLTICFLIQFIIACTCLGFISVNSKYDPLSNGWYNLSEKSKQETQIKYNCCGFSEDDFKILFEASKCPEKATGTCYEPVKESVKNGLKSTGIVALIFSFTNLLGVWLAYRYRNQRDPKCNPNTFL
ncbi:unnamed protein product [Brachionus calyciflorus]|uniref:Tetraspanin n=1 Tax=Brachionus calyciflorus TaxID=104777 RepID=A0A814C7Z7_9BILA|nr:unnamed protein product [Brachionus calyciflorus]